MNTDSQPTGSSGTHTGTVRTFAADPCPSYLASLAAQYGVPVLDTSGRAWLLPGMSIRVRLPYSEVCMHMGCAGKVMVVQLTSGAHPMAQLYSAPGVPFSFPVGTGEASIYGNSRDGFYAYLAAEPRLSELRSEPEAGS